MKPIYTLRIIYIIFWVSISCSFSNAQTLQVIPDDIYFNNNLGHSTDALTIRDDDGNSFELPEYSVYLGNRNNPFAYVMGQQSRTIEVVFSDSSPYEYDGMAHLIVNLSVTDGNGIGTVCNVFIPNYYLSGSPMVLNFNSPLPDVGKHEFTWKWDIYAIPVNEPGYCAGWNTTETTHTYYTVLAEPQAPMAEPWVSVLDYACVWANGESLADSVIKKVTEGIYFMGDTDRDIDYQLGSDYYPDYDRIRLSVFFDAINSVSNVRVNCTDCANLFNVFTSAVGFASNSKRIWSGIETNEIQPIGNSCSLGSVIWSYHQYGLCNSLVDDACLMLYENGILKVPTNMTQNNYDSLLMFYSSPQNSQIYTTIIQ